MKTAKLVGNKLHPIFKVEPSVRFLDNEYDYVLAHTIRIAGWETCTKLVGTDEKGDRYDTIHQVSTITNDPNVAMRANGYEIIG